jgi:hypothetical protein
VVPVGVGLMIVNTLKHIWPISIGALKSSFGNQSGLVQSHSLDTLGQDHLARDKDDDHCLALMD